ncbi:hypothetical protein JL100_033025 (plasmid) [Skermanella mucosa]|uniref:hypothetical protein n=1 Tax=Skermanella mucosa TaxID=1789672 RepID=UPI00192B74E7|nr:hypothetical protein [Skermanella mucosa]UEM24442.1 hypothetical protein JL100_033025 [Skermanella mucosa]
MDQEHHLRQNSDDMESKVMPKRNEAETVLFQVAGPDRYKVLAALEGSDPITRVSLTGDDATVTVEGSNRRLILGRRKRLARGKTAVMYLLSGSKRTVRLFDAAIRHVEALVELEGFDAVMRRLAGGILEPPLQRPRLEAVSATPGDPAQAPEDDAPPAPSAEAARRWADRKASMLRDNDHATGPELGRLVGSRAKNLAERASSWRREGRVFAVNDGSRDVYPLFQIKGDKPHPVVADVIGLLRPKLSDWEIFAWFTAPDTWSCEGRPPKDLLDSDRDSVLEAARHAVAEIRD